MDYFKINNRVYDVLVIDVEEGFEKLYTENTGRTLGEGARMTLDCIGTFIKHKITFKRKRGHESEFDELFDFLLEPMNDGFWVDLVHNQTTLHYEAYCSNGSRKVLKINKSLNKVDWDEMSVSFIPMEAQVTIA